jgi:hypothetical protein
VAELGGLTWTGYQTEDGLYLESAVAPGAEREGMAVRLRGKATTIALSSPSGLYDLEIRSAYTLKGRHVDYTDWTGEAAVVTAHDSIYVDLWLENPGGGNVGAYAGGDLRPDGTFDLKTRTGKRLTGRIGGGRFVAEWIDPREQGQFHGTLKGRHR